MSEQWHSLIGGAVNSIKKTVLDKLIEQETAVVKASKEFKIDGGVRQCYCILPKLQKVILEEVFRKLNEIKINEEHLY